MKMMEMVMTMKLSKAEMIKNIKQLVESVLLEEHDPTMLGIDRLKRYFQSKNYFIFDEDHSFNDAKFEGSVHFSASDVEEGSTWYTVTEVTILSEQEQKYSIFYHGMSGPEMLTGHMIETCDEAIAALDAVILPGRYQRTTSGN
jgi:hypothetical protein